VNHEHTFTDSDRAMLSARVDQFHDDLGTGSVADWEPYLLRLPKTLRKRVLIELAVVHLAHEWRAGHQPTVEGYLARFPELGPDAPEPLVLEEYRCRRAAKQPAETSEYASRFPALFPSAVDKLRGIDDEVSNARPSEAERVVLPLRGHTKVAWIGGGAFADVWLARNANGQEKALKIVRDRMTSEAAQRELKALEQVKNVRHRCVLVTEDYWIENGQLHIVSQLADGSLKGRMEECVNDETLPGIPAGELFGYFCDAAAGLDFLHEQGITHRDVKPDNILLMGGGAVLADFGLARKQVSLITQQSVFAGTPPYMAPELFGGEGGPPSDQYALALTYIHLRQGRHPLKLVPFPQIMTEHLGGEYDLSDFIGPAERAALLVALDQVPTNRFQNCQDFARSLAEGVGLPFQDRRKRHSGAQPIPAARPTPSDSVVPLASIGGSAVETASPKWSPLVNTDVGRRTVANPGAATPAEADAPPVRPPSKLLPMIAVGALVLALGGLIALLVSGGGGDTPATHPEVKREEPKANPKPIGTPPPKVAPPLVPPGTDPMGDDVEDIAGVKYPTWVTAKLIGVDVPFRFIPPALDKAGKLVGPLYLMEEKVSNRLVAGERYANPNAPTAPATGMTRAEAEAIAHRVADGQGRLPSPTEWDAAVGYFLPTLPAVLSKGRPVTNVAAPGESRKGTGAALFNDTSTYGLLDMAGNGCEWTSGTLPGERPRAVTRGRNFLLKDPLTFEILDAEQTQPKAAFADQGNKYTGFRVAIPAPTLPPK